MAKKQGKGGGVSGGAVIIDDGGGRKETKKGRAVPALRILSEEKPFDGITKERLRDSIAITSFDELVVVRNADTLASFPGSQVRSFLVDTGFDSISGVTKANRIAIRVTSAFAKSLGANEYKLPDSSGIARIVVKLKQGQYQLEDAAELKLTYKF